MSSTTKRKLRTEVLPVKPRTIGRLADEAGVNVETVRFYVASHFSVTHSILASTHFGIQYGQVLDKRDNLQSGMTAGQVKNQALPQSVI